MYSFVLMMALSSGTEMPAWGRCGGGRGCHGCSGCSGCYGGGYGGCSGGYGGCYGGGYGGCSGGYGGCGGYAGMAYSGSYGGYVVSPTVTTPASVVQASGQTPATLVVTLPAGAKLMIDDSPTSSTAASRVFQTPPLEPGYEYYYTLKAETMQDGKPVQVTNRATVRAGQTTSVRLEFPLANVARQ